MSPPGSMMAVFLVLSQMRRKRPPGAKWLFNGLASLACFRIRTHTTALKHHWSFCCCVSAFSTTHGARIDLRPITSRPSGNFRFGNPDNKMTVCQNRWRFHFSARRRKIKKFRIGKKLRKVVILMLEGGRASLHIPTIKNLWNNQKLELTKNMESYWEKKATQYSWRGVTSGTHQWWDNLIFIEPDWGEEN